MTDEDLDRIRQLIREELEPMDQRTFRLKRARIWASMLRRTIPAVAMVVVAGMLGKWGAYQEASYVAVAVAGGYAAASFQAAKKGAGPK